MLTVMEYAIANKLHPNTVHKMLRDGRLKGERVGKGWRIPEDAKVGEQVAVTTDPSSETVPEVTPEVAELDKSIALLNKQNEEVGLRKSLAAARVELGILEGRLSTPVELEARVVELNEREASLDARENDLAEREAAVEGAKERYEDMYDRCRPMVQKLPWIQEGWRSISEFITTLGDYHVWKAYCLDQNKQGVTAETSFGYVVKRNFGTKLRELAQFASDPAPITALLDDPKECDGDKAVEVAAKLKAEDLKRGKR